MMAAPFLAFVVSFALALRGRQRWALGALGVALALTAGVFVYHVSDPLRIAL
jgi:Family of unknown function (DUF5993)